MREKLGYFAAIITLVLYIAPAIFGPQFLQKYPVEIGKVVLFILTVILLWPLLKKLFLRFRKFIFRLFISDMKENVIDFVRSLTEEMEPDIKQMISRIRPQTMLNYEIQGPILKKEGYRHISARVQTVQLILEGTLDVNPGSIIKLKNIGYQVGKNFVQATWPDMSEFMLKQRGETIESLDIGKDPQSGRLKRIRLWADMEITAGWGEFIPEVSFSNDRIFGFIKIRECFLAAGRDEKSLCLCPFLEGYLESMLSGLLSSTIKVTIDKCGLYSGVDKICVFKVESTK